MATVQQIILDKALEKLVDRAEQEAYKVLGVKEEIQKLRRRLTRISSFLQDAERKRHTDAAINNWVKELKDIMYDADDIVDICMFGGVKLLEPQHPSSSSKSIRLTLFSWFSSVNYGREIANRIEKLNDRLKEIADDNNLLLPKLVESSNRGTQGSVVTSRATSPTQVDSDIVGTQIEDAANDIIKWILEDDKKLCQVYGIVGMGGIGKTTLACKIFNDQKIKDNFPTHIWLYISKNYSEIKLFTELIRGAGGNDHGAESIAELSEKLVNTLHSSNRNILLVLDDIWSPHIWNDFLRTPIVRSGVISKILITSRDVNVGRAMGATNDHIHHVEKIDEEGGWELLRNIVLQDGDKSKISMLKDVGMRIVARCDGLPLAIKVLAGILLCKETIEREWKKVLDSDLWQMNRIDDEIPKALYLSYEDLPFELRPYFLSCALFRGSTHHSHVVRFLMAEGFIVEQQNKSMEELGEDYYKELVSRNLLQLDLKYSDGSFFIMHDLLRALAANLMEEGIILSEGERLNTNNPLIKIRRLSMSNKKVTLILPSAVIEHTYLRVLVVHSSLETKTIEDDTLKKLKHLRVLDLSDTSIGSIPNSIGELLHLRCLYLNGINICELPESIVDLINLQTLSIRWCRSLYQLPNGITKLSNLRCLCLAGTPLTHVPKGIRKLTDINHLDGFVVGRDDSTSGEGCDFQELQYLSNLRFLGMVRLERASIKERGTVLANQTFLRQLVIHWNISGEEDNINPAPTGGEDNINVAPSISGEEDNINIPPLTSDEEDNMNVAPLTSDEEDNIDVPLSTSDEEDNINIAPSISDEEQKRAESVSGQLIPPSSLENIKIYNFPGGRFPGWIMSTSLGTSFPNLAYITIDNIPLCTVLPPLGQLPQLKFLVIKRAPGIKKIGPEFLSSHGFLGFPAFPKLHYLEFKYMPNWEEWELCVEQEEKKVGDKRNHLKLFPNLTKCYLIRCSRLISLPEAFYYSTNLKVLNVRHCERLERISNLPPLKELVIEYCSSLEHVENVDMPQSLYVTCVRTNSEFLPRWLPNLLMKCNHQSQHSLKDFSMRCDLPLLKCCLKGKPNWHIIQQIPEVVIKTIDNKHSMRYTKDPPYYETTVVIDSE